MNIHQLESFSPENHRMVSVKIKYWYWDDELNKMAYKNTEVEVHEGDECNDKAIMDKLGDIEGFSYRD